MTKGHRGTKHSLIRRANESMLKSLNYAYIHRRDRKGDMRRLWILRINAASRSHGLTYSQFMNGLKNSGVEINRKMLADMAVREPESFANLITVVRGQAQD